MFVFSEVSDRTNEDSSANEEVLFCQSEALLIPSELRPVGLANSIS
jgi:hypothetical protein